jgi:hypothetical protein
MRLHPACFREAVCWRARSHAGADLESRSTLLVPSPALTLRAPRRSLVSSYVALGTLVAAPRAPGLLRESAKVFYRACFSAAKRAASGVRWVGAGQLTLEAQATAVP